MEGLVRRPNGVLGSALVRLQMQGSPSIGVTGQAEAQNSCKCSPCMNHWSAWHSASGAPDPDARIARRLAAKALDMITGPTAGAFDRALIAWMVMVDRLKE